MLLLSCEVNLQKPTTVLGLDDYLKGGNFPKVVLKFPCCPLHYIEWDGTVLAVLSTGISGREGALPSGLCPSHTLSGIKPSCGEPF